MTLAERLIQNATDTANRLFPDDKEQATLYEVDMLRRYLREVLSDKENDSPA